MKEKSFYIETLGCQMNKLDSELVSGLLIKSGLKLASRVQEAEIAIINTCSVREHAELKALSKLGHLNHLRKRNGRPELIAIIGCFAQRNPEYICKRAEYIDVICGPSKLDKLYELIKQAYEQKQIAVSDFRTIRSGKEQAPEKLEFLEKNRLIEEKQSQAFVRVQRGCDKFCSYCIVPYVRGPEQSRRPNAIVEEIKKLDEAGYKEVTLLGQTINSYRYKENGKLINLAELLYRVHNSCSIPRIRFITSYPADFAVEIFDAMSELERICPYLHIPAQHGSNTILKAMNRKYSVEEYEELISLARSKVKGISIAGDFIVGFPGETEQDHKRTLELVKKIRYKNCFIFKYSVRPGTLAEKKFDKEIPDEIKTRRFMELQEIQDNIALEDNRRLIGQEIDVLVEGISKKGKSTLSDSGIVQLSARTVDDKIAVFEGHEELIGKIIKIKVIDVSSLTLFAEKV